MKATTAAIVLRASRARMEVNGFAQVGNHELYALMAAYEVSNKDKMIAKLLLTTIEAMAVMFASQGNTSAGIPGCVKAVEAFRIAYRALDLAPEGFDSTTEATKLPAMLKELKHALSQPGEPATNLSNKEFDKFMKKLYGDTEPETNPNKVN